MIPKVSVVLTSRNQAEFLTETLESILQQTLSDIEVIVVDDGSTEGSIDQIGSFSDSRVRIIILDKTRGACQAINAGIKSANAPIIAIAHPGDQWTSLKLATQIEILDSDPAIGSVFSMMDWIDEQGMAIDADNTGIGEFYRQSNRSRTQWLKHLVEKGNCLYHPSILIRRAVYDAVGEYDNFYSQLPDYDMLLRVLQQFEIFVLDEPTVRHRILEGSKKTSTPSNSVRDANERRLILQRFFQRLAPQDFAASFQTVRSPGDSHFSLPLEKILYLVASGNEQAIILRDVGLTLLRDFADRWAELSDALAAYGLSTQFPNVVMGISSPWFKRLGPLTQQEREVLGQLSEQEESHFLPISSNFRQSRETDKSSATTYNGTTFNLAIFDDCFPCELSAFRYQEFLTYLEQVQNTHVFSSGESLRYVEVFEDISQVIEKFGSRNPSFASNVSVFDPKSQVRAKLACCTFLHLAETFLPFFERNELPFIFTLYPGGGFRIEDPECKARIKAICTSKWFRGVITTQKLVTEYLLTNTLCSSEQITEIIGAVLPTIFESSSWMDKQQYGIHKTRIDICFSAYKYTQRGEDKGYDIFIECAKHLARKHSNVVFHVIGGFKRDDIDVSQLGPRVKFHGIVSPEKLCDLYRSMDIILSPNRGLVRGGQFDGFPTSACIAAGLCGVAVFCTDNLSQNVLLKDGTDFVLIELDHESICRQVEKFVQNPTALYWLARNGYDTFKRHFSGGSQLLPRLELISTLIGCEQEQAPITGPFDHAGKH
jgi:GT2 family glycosyltransferase/glycosyltransferase involved in cell wall biosynthesis